MWVLVAASYGFLVLGLFRLVANFCMNIDILCINEFQFGKKKRDMKIFVNRNNEYVYLISTFNMNLGDLKTHG